MNATLKIPRSSAPRRLIDIYYLLKEIPLNDMFTYYKQKYNQSDISAIKRSLVYFDDITDSNWFSVKLLNDKLSVESIKQTIINEINKYNENINIPRHS
jgi:hypothetical protein